LNRKRANGHNRATGSTEVVDVRDMLCAQALALVAEAVGRMAMGASLEVRYNAEDVKRALEVWAGERGYGASDVGPSLLRIQRTS